MGDDGEKIGFSKRFGVSRSAPRDLGYEALHGVVVGNGDQVVDTRPAADIATLTDPSRAPIEVPHPIGSRIIPRMLILTDEMIGTSLQDTGVEALDALGSGGDLSDAVVHVIPHGNQGHLHFQVNAA